MEFAPIFTVSSKSLLLALLGFSLTQGLVIPFAKFIPNALFDTNEKGSGSFETEDLQDYESMDWGNQSTTKEGLELTRDNETILVDDLQNLTIFEEEEVIQWDNQTTMEFENNTTMMPNNYGMVIFDEDDDLDLSQDDQTSMEDDENGAWNNLTLFEDHQLLNGTNETTVDSNVVLFELP